MSRIKDTFSRLSEEKKGALIPFLMAGDPDGKTFLELAGAVLEAGAHILEIGIPFSDPVADGPTIQRAGQRALQSGTDIPAVFEAVRSLRKMHDHPLVLMGYFNPVYIYGGERFLAEAAGAGADGILMVDLPPEEGRSFFSKARKYHLDPILMISPTTSGTREKAILEAASGFIYCVSRRGTTGAREDIPKELRKKVHEIKGMTRLPVAVGFGLSDSDQVRRILSLADGAVIGSALIAAVEKEKGVKAKIGAATAFIEKMKKTR